MKTEQLIEMLRDMQKEYPLADVLSAGIYDIEYFNDGSDYDEQIDIPTWNLIVERAKELVNWEQINEHFTEALIDAKNEVITELERDKELWGENKNESQTDS